MSVFSLNVWRPLVELRSPPWWPNKKSIAYLSNFVSAFYIFGGSVTGIFNTDLYVTGTL
jgi:hypothetical protein